MPLLKYLRCRSSLHAVAQIVDDHDDSTLKLNSDCTAVIRRRLSLKELYCAPYQESVFPFRERGLAAAIQLCPNLSTVEISGRKSSTFTDQDLQHLLNLKQLQSLSLNDLDVSFNGGLLPILKKFGPNSLEILKIDSFKKCVQVDAILEVCPNLEHLTLGFCEWKCSRPSPSNHRLLHLKHLNIFTNPGDDVTTLRTPTDLLMLLASCPQVAHLYADGFDELNDDLLEKAAAFNGFRCLEFIALARCNNITTRSIDFLLKLKDSPLGLMTIVTCELFNNISGDKMAEWQNFINNQNLNVTFYIE